MRMLLLNIKSFPRFKKAAVESKQERGWRQKMEAMSSEKSHILSLLALFKVSTNSQVTLITTFHQLVSACSRLLSRECMMVF